MKKAACGCLYAFPLSHGVTPLLLPRLTLPLMNMVLPVTDSSRTLSLVMRSLLMQDDGDEPRWDRGPK